MTGGKVGERAQNARDPSYPHQGKKLQDDTDKGPTDSNAGLA